MSLVWQSTHVAFFALDWWLFRMQNIIRDAFAEAQGQIALNEEQK